MAKILADQDTRRQLMQSLLQAKSGANGIAGLAESLIPLVDDKAIIIRLNQLLRAATDARALITGLYQDEARDAFAADKPPEWVEKIVARLDAIEEVHEEIKHKLAGGDGGQ